MKSTRVKFIAKLTKVFLDRTTELSIKEGRFILDDSYRSCPYNEYKCLYLQLDLERQDPQISLIKDE